MTCASAEGAVLSMGGHAGERVILTASWAKVAGSPASGAFLTSRHYLPAGMLPHIIKGELG